MKNTLATLYLFIVLLLFNNCSSYKIIDNSNTKQPQWTITKNQKDVFVGVSKTIANKHDYESKVIIGKEEALNNLLYKVSKYTISQIIKGKYGDKYILHMLNNYVKQYEKTKSLPGKDFHFNKYLKKNNSLYYWKYYKANGSKYIDYYIKENISDNDIKNAITEWQKNTKYLSGEELILQNSNPYQIQNLDETIKKIKILEQNKYLYKNISISKINKIIERYRQEVNNVKIEIHESKDKNIDKTYRVFAYELIYTDEEHKKTPVQTNIQPTILSSCSNIELREKKGYWFVYADVKNCTEQDKEKIIIDYDLGIRNIHKEIEFDVSNIYGAKVVRPIQFKYDLIKVNFKIPIDIQFKYSIKIESIDLNVIYLENNKWKKLGHFLIKKPILYKDNKTSWQQRQNNKSNRPIVTIQGEGNNKYLITSSPRGSFYCKASMEYFINGNIKYYTNNSKQIRTLYIDRVKMFLR